MAIENENTGSEPSVVEESEGIDPEIGIEILRRLRVIWEEISAEKRRKKLTPAEEMRELSERYRKLYESYGIRLDRCSSDSYDRRSPVVDSSPDP